MEVEMPDSNRSQDVQDAQGNTEIKIGVMGPTGTGKSSLIKLLTGDDVIEIGHGLHSKTIKINCHHVFEPTGRCVTFVDTPGFDDSREGVTDTDILKMISAFLEIEHQAGNHLTALIYLQRITDPRMGRSSLRNLRMFKNLCGTENLKNVFVVTTRWDRVEESAGIEREREMKDESNFFKSLLDGGARFLRHNNTKDSAARIIQEILGFDLKPFVPKIVEELEAGVKFGDTAAGSELGADIQALMKKHQEELADLRKNFEEASLKRDEEWKKELETERQWVEAEMAKWDVQKKELKVSLDAAKEAAASAKEAVDKERELQRKDYLDLVKEQRDHYAQMARQTEAAREKSRKEEEKSRRIHQKLEEARMLGFLGQVKQLKLEQQQREAEREKRLQEEKQEETRRREQQQQYEAERERKRAEDIEKVRQEMAAKEKQRQDDIVKLRREQEQLVADREKMWDRERQEEKQRVDAERVKKKQLEAEREKVREKERQEERQWLEAEREKQKQEEARAKKMQQQLEENAVRLREELAREKQKSDQRYEDQRLREEKERQMLEENIRLRREQQQRDEARDRERKDEIERLRRDQQLREEVREREKRQEQQEQQRFFSEQQERDDAKERRREEEKKQMQREYEQREEAKEKEWQAEMDRVQRNLKKKSFSLPIWWKKR